MTAQDVTVFDKDDQSYQRWLAQNPFGYVINTPRSISRNYMILHRSTCSSIKEYTAIARLGGFTQREYIKICSNDVDSLRQWVRLHGRRDGSFSSECQTCFPLHEFDDYDFDE